MSRGKRKAESVKLCMLMQTNRQTAACQRPSFGVQYSNHAVPFERILHTIFVHRRGDVVGHFLQFRHAIAHRHANGGLLDDGNVIAAIVSSIEKSR